MEERAAGLKWSTDNDNKEAQQMVRFMAVIVVTGAFLMLGSMVLAHEEGGTHTITGEVVDLTCYLGHGGSGAAHKDCAQKCINAGLPVGIKSGDTLYLAVGSEHGTANAALAPLAGRTVTVEGDVAKKDGMHLVAIKKVTAHQ